MRSTKSRLLLQSRIVLVCVLLLGGAGGHAASADVMRDALVQMYGAKAVITPVTCTVPDAVRDQVKERCGRTLPASVTLWRIEEGGVVKGWALKDDVRGKTQPITYMTVFTPGGSIHAVEILVYRESHGGEVQSAMFTRQFVGKSAESPLRVGTDIRNISGATISSRAVTNGARALAMLFAGLRASGTLAAK